MKDGANLKTKVLSGLFWRYFERCAAQGVTFIVGIVLARVLTPDDYGLSSLSAIYIGIISIISDLGLTQAVIQKKDADEIDYNSVFYVNLFMAVLVYFIIFFTAPFAAMFYEQPRLTAIIRVSSLTMPISALFSMQSTIITKRMEFKKYFWATITGTIISSFVGIALALNGMGVWAIVGQSMTNTIIDRLFLTAIVRWKPKAIFSLKRVKPLFNYAWKLLASRALDQVYGNIYSLVIGRVYSTSDLAYYERGKQYPMYIINNINESILSVLFPAISTVQNKIEDVKNIIRRSIVTSSFFIFPMMTGLGVMAELIIHVMITDKWLPAVPFIRFCCFTYALWPIHTANLQAISALGRSDIFLKLEIIKKVIGISVLLITLPHGLIAMMWGSSGAAIISSFLNASPNKKLLGYSYLEQLRDLMPSAVLSVVMGVCVFLIGMIPMNDIVKIFVQVISGAAIYFGLAKLFELECFEFVIKTVKELKYRKEN